MQIAERLSLSFNPNWALKHRKYTKMTSKNQAGAVAAVDNNTFDETVLKGQGVVLVDFWASWCEPCHKLAPLLRKLTLDYANDLTVFAFDVDGNGGLNEVGSRFDFDGIPALLFF